MSKPRIFNFVENAKVFFLLAKKINTVIGEYGVSCNLHTAMGRGTDDDVSFW